MCSCSFQCCHGYPIVLLKFFVVPGMEPRGSPPLAKYARLSAHLLKGQVGGSRINMMVTCCSELNLITVLNLLYFMSSSANIKPF